MNTAQQIRRLLGVSQAELARAIGRTQGNVSFYERKGQAIPPAVAKRLIGFAATRGISLTTDQIYGLEPIRPLSATAAATEATP